MLQDYKYNSCFTAFQTSSHCSADIMNGRIQTLFFPFMFLVLGCFIGKVPAQETIDEIISTAANSSEEFSFLRNGGDFVIRTELDMLYTRDQWSELIRLNNTASRKKRKAIKSRNYRWTNKIVPYEVYGSFSQNERNQIKMAINEWNQYTCLKFRRASYSDRNRIRMQNGGGCSSYVGMHGGTQPVSLARNCRVKKIIVHELGHAIGFQHEQTRPDRDNYVYILRQNIPGSMYYNFQRFTTGYVDDHRVPYDYTSVMHYGAYAFSHNGQRTIQTKNSKYQNIIGKAPGLSFRDIKLANLMYQCGSHCGGKSCPGQGYLDKNCQCMCPGPSPYQPTQKCSGGGGGNKDCVDKNADCKRWASTGECKKNPKYMLENCKKSCKKCGGGGGGDENKRDCVDKNDECKYWASNSECEKNPDYMLVNCKKSCKKCSGGGGGGEDKGDCVDKNDNCKDWASNSECEKNPDYMLVNCKKSCNKCSGGGGGGGGEDKGDCVDKNDNCKDWASNSECEKNPDYMLVNCKKSCKKCSGGGGGGGEDKGDCVDKNDDCKDWASNSECEKNPDYMLVNCKKSCKNCSGGGGGGEDKGDCVDDNQSCAIWAKGGECAKNPGYMHIKCKKSCKKCEAIKCADKNKHCAYWASIGECTKNPRYMTPNCQKSCKKCSSSAEGSEVLPKELQCTDENNQCSSWALLGECQNNPSYMLQYCKKSCQYCPSKDESECNNHHSSCPFWASIGECNRNPAYMNINCRKSCKLCQSHIAIRDIPCLDLNNNCSDWKSLGFCTDPMYKFYMSTNCPQSCGACS